MEIFDYKNYKDYVREKVSSYPKKGHGMYRQLGIHISLNSVAVSQVFKSKRDLSLEQALGVSEFFNLTELEQDYFLLMVQYERAGNHKLKKIFLNKMTEIKKKSENLKDRLSQTQDISLEAKATYYSNWIYSGVRIASSIDDGGQSIEALAKRLGVLPYDLTKVLEFLTENGLCKKIENKYTTGIGITHLEATSPLVLSHHRNWRIKAIEKMNRQDEDQIFYTIPLSISKNDLKNFRKKIVMFVEEINQALKSTSAEEVACLNIDWFKFSF